MRMTPGVHLGGRYLLEDRIATGGVGEVWKAVDESTGRWVAVKVLRDRHAGDAGFRERFRAEAHHTAALAHPGLTEVLDYVEDGALAYLVMEYVPGKPLSVLLRGGRELGSRLTLGIIGQIAVTLQAAHDAGVVHRDIKPDNLIVGYDGQVKVTDFGIARGANMATLTQPGVVLGTAVYMSPEQAEAQRVTAATDIYSLGVVCYECLAGRVPFLGSTPVEIAYGHVRELPPALPAYVPRALRDLVSRCLAKNPAARPATMAEVAEVAYSIAQTLKPAGAPAYLAAEPADPHLIAAQRGKHRAAPRRRHRLEMPACPGAGAKDTRTRRRVPAVGAAVLGAVARPALGLPPPRRRRAVVASLAGTTVLASGLVLGTQIGLFPTMKPFRGVEAPASPTPAVTPRGAGHPVPKPPVSSLHSGAPSARGGDRASGSHSPSPSSSQTPTPGATVSAPSTSPALPAPSRPGELTPTPTPSPDELPSATPSQTPSAQPTPPADDQDSGVPEGDEGEADRGRDDRVPQTTASGTASSAPATSDGNDNTENRTPVADMTGSASPTAEVGVDLGAVDLNVNVPDGDATAPTE